MIRNVFLDRSCWAIGYRRERWGKLFTLGPIILSDNTAASKLEAVADGSDECTVVAYAGQRAIYLHMHTESFFFGFHVHREIDGVCAGVLFPKLLFGPATFVLGVSHDKFYLPILFPFQKWFGWQK